MALKKTLLGGVALLFACAETGSTTLVDDPVEAAGTRYLRTQSARDRAPQCSPFTLRGRRAPPARCGGLEAALPPPLAEACPDNQWVGLRLSGARCPEAGASRTGQWLVSAPMARATTPLLRRFCKYRWQPATLGAPPDISALPNSRAVRMERDCEVVGPNGRPPNGAREALEDGYDAQVDLPTWGAPVSSAAAVRIAVVDTSPHSSSSGFPSSGASPHGEAMGTIARRVSCTRTATDEGQCASVATYNGLPRLSTTEYGMRGGYYGSQMELAAAMFQAVDEWETDPNAPQRLILNLSVGWEETYGGAPQVGMRLPAAAVWLVAQYASCKGALLIASAGNQSSISNTAGPLYPAAWEQNPSLCSSGSAGVYEPLVHSVGGVDGRDELLAMSRAQGTPRLVAPASSVSVERVNAVAAERTGSAVLSGTSVAAAGVSGAAALIWSLRPQLPPWQVMEVLYGAAEPVGGLADYGFTSSATGRRRLSACRAAQAACAVASCPQPQPCGLRPAGVDASPDFDAVVASAYPGVVLTAGDYTGDTVPAGGEDHWDLPFVGPQPGAPICPLCGILDGQLVGSLEPKLDILKLTLRINAKLATEQTSAVNLPPDGPFKVPLPESMTGVAIKNASLEGVTLENGKQVVRTSELFVK